MQQRASLTRTALLDRPGPNPFRTSAHWSLGPHVPRLELASAGTARPTEIPSRPTLLTGAVGSGRRATLDHLAARAAGDGWAVVRLDARDPEHERRADDPPPDGPHVGVLVCIDHLHAAPPARCASVMAAVEHLTEAHAPRPVRVVATATHRSSLATDERTRASFADVELLADLAGLATVFGTVAALHGRELGIDAARALHGASRGIVDVALEHAAAAWETTRGDITADHVAAIAPQVEATRHARLRAAHSSHLSLGQRRYLRAVAANGADRAPVDDVRRTLCELTRFTITDSMLEAVSGELVRKGLLVVCDDVATIVAPGLAQVV